jgi:hypothetical protein
VHTPISRNGFRQLLPEVITFGELAFTARQLGVDPQPLSCRQRRHLRSGRFDILHAHRVRLRAAPVNEGHRKIRIERQCPIEFLNSFRQPQVF